MYIVLIKFNNESRLQEFSTTNLDLIIGDLVLVETEKGLKVGTVVRSQIEYKEVEGATPKVLPKVIRKVRDKDLEVSSKNSEREKRGLKFCAERAVERNLDMKLVKVEFVPRETKMIFYFTADGRIDFRELVKDLAAEFKMRIQMQQIGVRDETMLLGGLGGCGRELCCSSYLVKFSTVSIKMAKDQNIALNPTKISGICGRLLCCLNYEHETYLEAEKNMPKCSRRIKYCDEMCTVKSKDVLRQMITAETDDGKQVIIKDEELKKIVCMDERSSENHEDFLDDELKKLEDVNGPSAILTAGDSGEVAEPVKTEQTPQKRPYEERKRFDSNRPHNRSNYNRGNNDRSGSDKPNYRNNSEKHGSQDRPNSERPRFDRSRDDKRGFERQGIDRPEGEKTRPEGERPRYDRQNDNRRNYERNNNTTPNQERNSGNKPEFDNKKRGDSFQRNNSGQVEGNQNRNFRNKNNFRDNQPQKTNENSNKRHHNPNNQNKRPRNAD